MDNRPIGIFDSGLGGLTTVKTLRRLLPGEDIVYFGDTGRVPYGTRGRETIQKYTRQDIAFLRGHDVKLIIIACGTASSNLTPETEREADVPVFGVVHPAAQAAAQTSKTGRIGVIGTPATIHTGAYERALGALCPDAQVTAAACPLFVPLVENGLIEPDNEVTNLIAQRYLAPVIAAGVDTLILGCTHYPLIHDIIDRQMGGDVSLIDSGGEVAHLAKSYLAAHDMMHTQGSGTMRFFVSDAPDEFTKTAELFLGTKISDEVTQVDLDAICV